MYGPFTGATFTLFHPEPPDTRDMSNLVTSKVRQVMTLWDTATPQVLDKYSAVRVGEEADRNPVNVILRMQNEDLLRDPGVLQQQLYQKQQHANILAIIMGNEWDFGVDLRWRTPEGRVPEWGNNPSRPGEESLIQRVNRIVLTASDALDGMGPMLVSPAYIERGHSEHDVVPPGLFTWREITQPVFYGYESPIEANAAHIYEFDWPGQVNKDRFIKMVYFWQGFHHHTVLIDEFNVDDNLENPKYTQVQRMDFCLEAARLLRDFKNALGYRLGERVGMFCPFTSNGLGNAYPSIYIMRNPECYAHVRTFMEECGL